MKNNKGYFDELLDKYNKQKSDYELKQKACHEAHSAWWQEVEANGDWTEKADALGVVYDKTSSDLENSRIEYDVLAHEVLKAYMLL